MIAGLISINYTSSACLSTISRLTDMGCEWWSGGCEITETAANLQGMFGGQNYLRNIYKDRIALAQS